MEVALPIILFVTGFVVGGFVVWQMKQRELEDRRRSEEELEAARQSFLAGTDRKPNAIPGAGSR